MADVDNPLLARVYAETLQRVPCDFSSLNSNGTFILVCGLIRKVYLWYGANSSVMNKLKAEDIANEILRDDFCGIGDIDSIVEFSEVPSVLSSFLEQLYVKIDDYDRCATTRSSPIENSPVTVSIVDRRRSGQDGSEVSLILRPVSHSAVLADGSVALLPFISDVNKKSIVVLATGSQYDIWFAEAVSRREKAAIRAYITEMAMYKVPVKRRSMESVLFDKNLCIAGQDKETVLFRHYFTEDTRHLITSNMKMTPNMTRKDLPRTHVHGNACSDCLGDALFRLFGISPQTAGGDSKSATFSDGESEDDSSSSVSTNSSCGDSVVAIWNPFSYSSSSSSFSALSLSAPTTQTSSSSGGASTNLSRKSRTKAVYAHSLLRPTDALSLKILRLANKTEIHFLNPPRRNTKLLVLDLDHTLMDFSCRFDFMAEHLKRPYLDHFLSSAYNYYDIAVWSQTNFKWLELKLSELGMMDRDDYKICFALVGIKPVILYHYLTIYLARFDAFNQDKSTMFTVKQQYVKPLKIIWHKCIPMGWGPHNTVHVDDLERNFELNKQSGILVSPFHLKSTSNAGHLASPRSLPNMNEHSYADDHAHDHNHAMAKVGSEKCLVTEGVDVHGHANGYSRCDDTTGEEEICEAALNDVELALLARYLVHIAETEADFTDLDHSEWRTVATSLVNTTPLLPPSSSSSS